MSLMRREWPDLPEMFRRFWEGPDMIGRFWEGEPEFASWLRVEEFVEGNTLVIRTELPDIDPDKDVDLSVQDGQLRIKAEKQAKTENKEKDSYRSEFRYGSFFRSIPLPSGATEDDVKATYKDGVLEIRVPLGEAEKPAPVKVPITRT